MADHIYRLPREAPTPAPYALSVGLDWLDFSTPPYAGGLTDQPIQLLKEIRLTLKTYNAIQAYRTAKAQLSDEGFIKFCNANSDIMKFMEFVWSLQADESETDNAPDG